MHTHTASPKPNLHLILASPRGFCAGVDRAIQIVERAISKYGAPVYVRHEIVHNHHVVKDLENKGAVFVDSLNECPQDRPVIFSAHGVPKSVPQTARNRNMFYLDATCPLVSKVHIEARRHFEQGREIILIGHKNHPEVIGTMGQLPENAIFLIETKQQVESYLPQKSDNIAVITQTTLSVDDTADIIKALKARFPNLHLPHKEDICYATTNRQAAVKVIAQNCDILLIIGSETSSNSLRLVEVGQKAGARQAMLIAGEEDLPWDLIKPDMRIGLSAGASAPELLVENVITALQDRFTLNQQDIKTAREDITFRLPRQLEDTP